jgi:hypothetical protein
MDAIMSKRTDGEMRDVEQADLDAGNFHSYQSLMKGKVKSMQPKPRPFDIPGSLFDGGIRVAAGRLVGTFITEVIDTEKGPRAGAPKPTDTQFIVAEGDIQGKTVLTFHAPGMKQTRVTINTRVRAHPPTYDVALGS